MTMRWTTSTAKHRPAADEPSPKRRPPPPKGPPTKAQQATENRLAEAVKKFAMFGIEAERSEIAAKMEELGRQHVSHLQEQYPDFDTHYAALDYY